MKLRFPLFVFPSHRLVVPLTMILLSACTTQPTQEALIIKPDTPQPNILEPKTSTSVPELSEPKPAPSAPPNYAQAQKSTNADSLPKPIGPESAPYRNRDVVPEVLAKSKPSLDTSEPSLPTAKPTKPTKPFDKTAISESDTSIVSAPPQAAEVAEVKTPLATKPTLEDTALEETADRFTAHPQARDDIIEEIIETKDEITVPEFNVQDLPITLSDIWTLTRTQNSCSLSRAPIELDDNAGGTPVVLTITEDAIRLATQSNIDLSYPNSGIIIEHGQRFPLETVEQETNASIQKNYPDLISALKETDKVIIAIGFWPTWPMTEAKQAVLDIPYFAQAYQAWQTCYQLVNAISPD